MKSFAMEMFREGTKLENKSMSDLVNGDVKKFVVEDENIRVCQIFTMNLDSLNSIEEGLKEKMEEVRVANGESTFVMMLTDIFKEISEVIVVGEYIESIKNVFGVNSPSNSFKVPGLLSRKKQLIPSITSAIQK